MNSLLDNQIAFQLIVGLILWLLPTYLYIRFTHGVGKSLFIFISIIFWIVFMLNPIIPIFISIFAIIAFTITRGFQSTKKQSYQKAIAKFEGGGIRRGLTPPEAVAIMGKPYSRIIVLIIMSLLEKGFVALAENQPLKLHVSKLMRTRALSLNAKKRSELRRKAAQELKQVLYPFEEPFLELIEQESGKGIGEIDFGVTIKPFIHLVSERVGGYDLDQTRAYYQQLVRKVTLGGDIESSQDKGIIFDFEWKFVDENIKDSEKNKYRPKWFLNFKDLSKMKQESMKLYEWVQNLEDAIESGLSQDDFEIKVSGELESISSEIITDIVKATYHN
jgi:hypothetical protein